MKKVKSSLKRKLLLLAIGLIFNSFVQAQNTVATTQMGKDKPNILVFLVDDLGYMDIGANNPDCFYDTPNIDALAKSGMRFTNGYAANPVCSPTRYSLMTGKYPSRVDATNFFSGKRSGKFNPAPLVDNMPLEDITIAQALKAEGYATFFAGKWHLGESEAYYPQNRGFDINMGGHKRGGPYTGKRYFSPFENPQLHPDSPEGDHLPDRLARETTKFIKENKDQPFFAYLSFYSVHTPLMGRPDLVAKYEKRASEVHGEEFAEEEQIFGDRSRKVRILQKHAVYAAMVEAMDQAVGKVLQQLEESGVADNTIIVFTSDNGGLSTSEGLPTSNLPLRGGKGWVYEGGIREPWIIRYPGVTKTAALSHDPICSIDLFPTLAAAAGAKVKHEIDGLDLRPLLRGESAKPRSLYWHYPHYSNQGGIPGGAIREGDYKLIERYEDGRIHLYNLKDDIGEQRDLAKRYPEKASQMRGRLHAWYKEVGAKFLQKKENGPEPWRPPYLLGGGNSKTGTINVIDTELSGIGRQQGVMRRDPSDVIKVNDLYYVWYSKGKIAPGYDATVWYATSPDGIKWTEQSMALAKGEPGSWEGESVFTPNILVAEGKYWLFYTGVSRKFSRPYNPDSKIGIAVSDSPAGPWERLSSNPALTNSDTPEKFDSHLVDDACLIVRDEKYWLYYKGRQLGKSPAETKMGVAIADHPQGPYVKHETNPVIPGNHEVLVWPQGRGVAAMIGTTGPNNITSTIQYAEDGIHFSKTHDVHNVPSAGGAYRPEAFTQSGAGDIPKWGVEIGKHQKKGELPFIQRFDLVEE